MNLDYLNQNSLIRYPFKDGASLKSGSFVLSNNVFLDLQLVILNGGVRAYLRRLVKGGGQIAMTFETTTDSGVDHTIILINGLYSDFVVNDFVSYASDDYRIKIVVGQGILDLINGADFDVSFSLATAELTSSVVISNPPYVKSIRFVNLEKVNDVPNVEIVQAIIAPGEEFKTQEGYNVEYALDDGALGIKVIPGVGAGLYDACAELSTDEIRDINGIQPDSRGNFQWLTDSCYSSEKSYETTTETIYVPTEPPEFYWTGISTEDHAGVFDVFSPGAFNSGDPHDYKWELYLFLTVQKTIRGISVYQSDSLGVFNGSEHWSTMDPNTVIPASSWPLVVFKPDPNEVLGTQLNTHYNQTLGTYKGLVHFTMFGQPRIPVTTYFTMKILYTDNTFEVRTTRALIQQPTPSDNTPIEVETNVVDGLRFKHTCTPKCSEEQVRAYAYYLNRVKDGLLTVSSYANSIRDDLAQAIEDYKTRSKVLAYKMVPYIGAEHLITNASNNNYVSVAVGIFDPRKTNLTSTLEVNFSPPFTYAPKTSRLNTGEILQQLPDAPGFVGKTLSCQSSSVHEFVLVVPETWDADNNPLTAEVPVKNQTIELMLTHSEGTAFKLLPLLMEDPFFAVRYTNFFKDGLYRVNFIIDMFDPLNRTTNVSLSTTLPAGLVYEANTAKLNRNNVITNLASQNMPSTNINFSHRASISFVAQRNSTTIATQTINVTMNTPFGNFTKQIPIKFLV